MSTPKLYSIGSYGDTSKRFTIEGDNNHVGINVTPDSDYPLYVESHSGHSIKCDGNIGIGIKSYLQVCPYPIQQQT